LGICGQRHRCPGLLERERVVRHAGIQGWSGRRHRGECWRITALNSGGGNIILQGAATTGETTVGKQAHPQILKFDISNSATYSADVYPAATSFTTSRQKFKITPDLTPAKTAKNNAGGGRTGLTAPNAKDSGKTLLLVQR
jgi:hypothetical protein